MGKQEISAYFSVTGSTYRGIEIDTKGRTPDEIAAMLDAEFDGVSMCHQCASECEDPEGELSAFIVDNVDYVFRDGHWVPVRL